MAKKFDDIKEVISANSTPVKGAIGNATSAISSFMTEDDSTDASSDVPDGEIIVIIRLFLYLDLWTTITCHSPGSIRSTEKVGHLTYAWKKHKLLSTKIVEQRIQ